MITSLWEHGIKYEVDFTLKCKIQNFVSWVRAKNINFNGNYLKWANTTSVISKWSTFSSFLS